MIIVETIASEEPEEEDVSDDSTDQEESDVEDDDEDVENSEVFLQLI